jgi:membrane protein implicated in regulation of membrane protease activity
MALSYSAQKKLFIAGYTAKGIVYSLIGFFAIAGVVSGASGGGSGGPKAVIQWIGTNPFGQVLLFLIGVGLLAYCSWRWYSAVKDKQNDGQDKEGIAKRIGFAVSGTAYGVLSVYAFKLAFGGGDGGGNSKQDIIARMLSESWGPWAVGIIAAIVAGVAIFQLVRAIQDKHMEGIEGQGLSHDERETFEKTGEVGLTARFVVYGIISYFLFRAALMDDPSQFRGIGGSLNYIEDQSYGAFPLVAVGIGLLAYGIFMFVRARYERP